MLNPEKVIERAKKWEVVFEAYDQKRLLEIEIISASKNGYLVKIVDLDLEAKLLSKKKYEPGKRLKALIISANYVDKKIKMIEKLLNENYILNVVKKAKKKNKTLKAIVNSISSGGYEITIMGKKGFIPPSHIPKKLQDDMTTLIGKEVDVYILRANGDLILASLKDLRS